MGDDRGLHPLFFSATVATSKEDYYESHRKTSHLSSEFRFSFADVPKIESPNVKRIKNNERGALLQKKIKTVYPDFFDIRYFLNQSVFFV